MMDLTEGLLKRRYAVIVCLAILILMGIVSYVHIPICFYPQVDKPRIGVRITGSGQSAVDLYTLYGRKLDNIIENIEDAERVTAEYTKSAIEYTIEFPWNYDVNKAREKVEVVSPRIKAVFPTDSINGFKDPSVYEKSASGSNSQFAAALHSDGLTSDELYKEAKNLLQGDLNRNVRYAQAINFQPVQLVSGEIQFNIAAMLGFGLTPQQVMNTVKSRYLDQSLGTFRDGRTNYTMRCLSEMQNISELENIIILTHGDQPIRLKDIADVSIKRTYPPSVFRVNGEASVMITAESSAKGNIRTMSRDMQKQIK